MRRSHPTGGRSAKSCGRSATSRSPSISKRPASNSKTSTRTTEAGANYVGQLGCRLRRRAAQEGPLLRAVGRLLHVDDGERLDAYRSLVDRDTRTRGRRPQRSRTPLRTHADRIAHNLEDLGIARRGSRGALGVIRRSAANCWSSSTSSRNASTTFTRRSASRTFRSPSTPATRGPRSWPRSTSAQA